MLLLQKKFTARDCIANTPLIEIFVIIIKFLFSNKGVINSNSASNLATELGNLEINAQYDVKPVKPLPPFNRGRMITVIVYGWEPWEAVIGRKGVAMADKLFHEFDLNPLRNIEESDLKGLKGSLKIIMSSKLVGADRYLEPKNTQNDIPYCSLDEWIVFLHQKFEKLVTPHWNPDYNVAKERIAANTKKIDSDND